MRNRPYRTFVVFVEVTLLFVLALPVVDAAPAAESRELSPVLLPAWAQPRIVSGGPGDVYKLLPGGSTISGTLTSDDTWGPGVITVTGDITIPVGVDIFVVSGTTVRMASTDGLGSGVAPSRIEWIISGTLDALDATFTSVVSPSLGAEWYGIYHEL